METSKKLAIAFCQEQVIFHQCIINLGAGFHGSSILINLIEFYVLSIIHEPGIFVVQLHAKTPAYPVILR
jgi:hypothetical protein